MFGVVAKAFKNPTISTELIQEIGRDTKLYAIFMTARSGSTWLTEMARNSGILGTPQEWFNESWIYSDTLALGCRPPQFGADV